MIHRPAHRPPASGGRRPLRAWAAGLAGVALALCGPALALRTGTTPQGVGWQSGGVTFEERNTMQMTASSYTLWVVTAASKSGAFLADVQVTIRDEQGREVFDRRLDGPWLYVDLPLGRYVVEARRGGATQRRATTIHRGDQHQAVFYFDTGDEVAGEAAPAPAPPR